MKNETITLSEYARLRNCSVELARKEIQTQNSQFLITINGIEFVDLAIFQSSSQGNTETTQETPQIIQETENSQEFIKPPAAEAPSGKETGNSQKDIEIDRLIRENQELKEAIQEKDTQLNDYHNQIFELSLKIAELAENNQKLVSQSQYLQLSQGKAAIQKEISQTDIETSQDDTQKRGFFKRLFHRK